MDVANRKSDAARAPQRPFRGRKMRIPLYCLNPLSLLTFPHTCFIRQVAGPQPVSVLLSAGIPLEEAQPVFRGDAAALLQAQNASGPAVDAHFQKERHMPTPILEKTPLIPGKTSKLVLQAPEIARHARPGHFVMLRMSPTGERIPLTIADTDAGKGTVTIVYLVLGKSTAELERLNAGDAILDVCGPLGHPTHIEKRGTVICVGGGTGIAAMHHIAKGHKRAGNRVIGVIGARGKDLLLFEDELRSFADELLISTDDGSRGHKGLVTDLLRDRLEKDKDVFEVVAVGPVPMMAAVADTTRPFQVKTTVSLNPIMVDGIGMCGACRVTVDGKTKFACVDGPEFDGHAVDFAELRRRLGAFREQEKLSLDTFRSAHGN